VSVVVTAAIMQDCAGAQQCLEILRCRRIWADQAYTDDLVAWVRGLRSWRHNRLEVVNRLEGLTGFHVVLKCGIGERTVGRPNRYRC